MKKIGIVIVNYNDYSNTINLINEIIKYKSITEIVVVDSASSDNSVSEINKIKSNKLCVIETNNLGYSHALNVGSKYLLDKYKDINVILSNSDISIDNESVIKELNKMIDSKTKVVMPAIKERGIIKYGWKVRGKYIDLLNSIPFINRLYKNKLINYKKDYFDDIKVVDAIYGCFFMIDGSILNKINYFDENVFIYYEENILSHKLKKYNFLSKCNPNIFVTHKSNATIGTNISRLNKYKNHFKSKYYYEKEYNNARISLIFFKLFYYINLIPYKIRRK